MMTWWKTIIAVSIISACVANAGTINRTESVKPSAESKSKDDLCLTPECIHAASWILTNSNFSVDPCDDFYEFACGNVNLATIPDEHFMRAEILLAEDELFVRLRNLIEGIDKTKVPKHFGLLRTLYDNCMNAGGETYYAEQILRLKVKSALWAPNGWPVLLGNRWNDSTIRNKSNALEYLLWINWQADSENTAYEVPQLELEEGFLPTEIMNMGFNNELVQAYFAYMVDIAVLFGATKAQAEIELKEALIFGIDIAKSLEPEAKQWFHNRPQIRTTVGEFVKKYPKFNVSSFIFSAVSSSYNLSDSDVITVAFDYGKFEKVLSNASDRAMSNWVIWQSVQDKLRHFGTESQGWIQPNKNIAPLPAQKAPAWKKCVKQVRSSLGVSLSALYQRKYMSQNIVSDLAGIVTDLKRQMHQLLTEADWPDIEARRVIGRKIDDLNTQVSYRDEYVDDKKLERLYEKVELIEGTKADSLHNITNGLSSAFPDRSRSPNLWNDWLRLGNLLNTRAMYSEIQNNLVIDAPWTLKNFYHIDRPKYLNYGALGFVLAHEMGHLMSCTNIDGNLNEREWLSPESKRKFDERMQCIVDGYRNYTVEGLGIKLNGYRLAMETAADNIGIAAAYHAYLHRAGQNTAEKELPALPYTTKQLFWIGWASSMCQKVEKPTLRYIVAFDEHAPLKQRVNGAVASRSEFADDFKCKPESRMNPVQKCSVY